MTMSMWKNSFYCDIIGKKGSLHINSLGKWDKNTLILRKRKHPSGAPKEKEYKFPKVDKTWAEEYKYFKKEICCIAEIGWWFVTTSLYQPARVRIPLHLIF